MAVREGNYASWIGLEYRNKTWSLETTPEDAFDLVVNRRASPSSEEG